MKFEDWAQECPRVSFEVEPADFDILPAGRSNGDSTEHFGKTLVIAE